MLHLLIGLLKIPLYGVHNLQCNVKVTTKCSRNILLCFFFPPSFKFDFGRDSILKFVPEGTLRDG